MEQNEAFQDELLALESIYPSCLVPLSHDNLTYTLKIPDTSVLLNLQFTPDYPEKPPVVLHALGIDKALAEDVLLGVATGDVCVFAFIDMLKELVEVDKLPESPQVDDNQQVGVKESSRHEEQEKHSPVINSTQSHGDNTKQHTEEHDEWKPKFDWKQSDAITDRKSTFMASATRIHSVEDVEDALAELYMNKKIAKASHNMYAYRFISDHGNVVQDNDDDGETAAGSRMGHLLTMMDAKDVFVCVHRWFGGVHIGPDRFKHINSAAREAVLLAGACEQASSDANHNGKNHDSKKKKKHHR
ncbi:hypothetical protein SJAG_04873 [Schizosaccharomyces japonicus yFS275]|uniref:RWD domain-containing protein n=1 Tax=Schizosaccharomyces japonicus (strain yFS275 / FY16936) TaxID=402676 RepID=B6K7Z8_SCHJY|nr:hypothetical protein SJAG_04873 [Schizosaccharomyces japonicus yFS275]EEB09652.1 hypothetical protein SJAG_04873 [Schizosaccharomyces japonicus yFS275]